MIPATWFNSLSPGNEQMLYFGSRGPHRARARATIRASPTRRSMHAIKAMLDATSREEFVAAVHAEDRLLVSGFYMVPFYRCGRPVGGALEPYRPPGRAAAARASRQRHSGAILELHGRDRRRSGSTSRATACRASRRKRRRSSWRAQTTERWSYGALEDAVLRHGARACRRGRGGGRAAVHPHGQFARLCAGVLCRQCHGRGADPGLAHAAPR